MEYAAVAPMPNIMAANTRAAVARPGRCAATARSTAMRIEPTSTIQRNAGNQSGVRFSSTNAHTPVPAIIAASTSRAVNRLRTRHNSTTEMPTSAATAGASATV